MRRVLLLYNPASGINKPRRRAAVESAVKIFRAADIEVTTQATEAPGSAGAQARQAIESGCDTVIAGGGDGTLHEILQGVVGSPPEVAVGMLPLGTGNILARNLGIPSHNAAAAAQMLITAASKRIALGKIEYSAPAAEFGESRVFLLNAGVGIDALSMYRASLADKARFGEIAYYASGIKLLLTYTFPEFAVELPEGSAPQRKQTVSQVGAFRVCTLGGLIGELAPGAALERDDMQVIFFRTRSRWRYLQYSLRTALRRNWKFSEIELVHTREVICRAAETGSKSEKIYAQADGEVLGSLPVRISVVPNALTLLFPREAESTVRKS